MLKAEQVPDEVVEAAKREVAVTIYRLAEPDTRAHELTENEVAEIATAALRAGIAAWPGMMPVSEVFTAGGDFYRPHLILPLPQENNNAEG